MIAFVFFLQWILLMEVFLCVAVPSHWNIEAYLSNKSLHTAYGQTFPRQKKFMTWNEIKKLTRQALVTKVHLFLIQRTLEYIHSCVRPQKVKIFISLRKQKMVYSPLTQKKCTKIIMDDWVWMWYLHLIKSVYFCKIHIMCFHKAIQWFWIVLHFLGELMNRQWATL